MKLKATCSLIKEDHDDLITLLLWLFCITQNRDYFRQIQVAKLMASLTNSSCRVFSLMEVSVSYHSEIGKQTLSHLWEVLKELKLVYGQMHHVLNLWVLDYFVEHFVGKTKISLKISSCSLNTKNFSLMGSVTSPVTVTLRM